MHIRIKEIFDSLFERYPILNHSRGSIYGAYDLLADCYTNGGKVLVCGNGGSAADALHIVGELMKSFVLPRKLPPKERVFSNHLNENLQMTLPAISLVNDISLMTAYANDNDGDLIFAQQVFGYGKPNDVLFILSTSGNSQNCLYAAEVAQGIGMKVLTLTGESGGRLAPLSDVAVCVQETETFKIQELHLPVYHAICLALEECFFGV
ncbi:MAG: SIS domain-containing protein [Oscillospiraceae bacterium]|nr:SIS domain-containing protein [Oscillospiraceae bacterium]